MATATIIKTVTYSDPDSSTSYNVTATKEIEAQQCDLRRYDLSPSTSQEIFSNLQKPYATGQVKYIRITNIGATNSAYIAIDDGTNDATIFEVAPGVDHDFFGDDIWGAGINNDQRIDTIWARGNTSIEVQIFT